MSERYSTNPAVQFRWQDTPRGCNSLTAVVAGSHPEEQSVNDVHIVELLEHALTGRSKDELRAYLIEEHDLERCVANEEVTRLIEDDLLLSEQQQIDGRQTWFEHEWDRSLYYHLSTRDEPVVEQRKQSYGDEADVPWCENESIELPSPADLPDVPFDEVLLDRRTCRDFDGTPIDSNDLSSILYHALAPIRDISDISGASSFLEITTFPITIYPVVARSTDIDCGVYRYDIDGHALYERAKSEYSTATEVDELLKNIVVNQPFVEDSSVTLLLSVNLQKYRQARPQSGAFRHLLTVVSAHAHRILLTATAFGFDVFQCAALKDSMADEVIDADGFRETVLYTITIGRAAEEQA